MKRMFATFKKKTIGLSELEQKLKPFIHEYEDFANRVLQFEEEEILVMVKSKGRTNRTPSLALQYRINKSQLNENYHKELQNYRTLLHSSINLKIRLWEGSIYLERRPSLHYEN